MNYKLLLTISSLIVFCSAFSQKVQYVNKYGEKTADSASAKEFYIVEKVSGPSDLVYTKTYYYMSGQKKYQYSFVKNSEKGKSSPNKMVGEERRWFENGAPNLKAYYNNEGNLHGHFLSYWKNGKLRRDDTYKNGKLEEGNCYDSLGNKLPKYFPYETMAEFPGGVECLKSFLKNNLKYPKEAAKQKISGRVVLRFVVQKDGTITDVKVLRKVDSELDLEAYRIVKAMPRWTPATRDGENVRMFYTLPVSFRLH